MSFSISKISGHISEILRPSLKKWVCTGKNIADAFTAGTKDFQVNGKQLDPFAGLYF
jgi:hypothetical protein